jgi:putative signal transducing protein
MTTSRSAGAGTVDPFIAHCEASDFERYNRGMSESDLVVVRTFTDRIEADLASSALDAAGIESMVRGDDAGGTQPGMAMGHPIELIVRAADAAAARDVLDTTAQPVPEANE